MFLRLLYRSFLRQQRRKLLAGLAVALGMTITTAMIAVGMDVGDKMNRELSALGPNILVTPAAAALQVDLGGTSLEPAGTQVFLHEADLPKLKQIFWAHNIMSFAPMLTIQVRSDSGNLSVLGTYFAKNIPRNGEPFITGAPQTHPWWKVEGAWPVDDSSDIALGSRLANRLSLKTGDQISLGHTKHRISGIVTTGAAEEDAVLAPLALVQSLNNTPAAVQQVFVRALTKQEDDFARRDPRTMSGEVLERWSCSPYANSIAYQIAQIIPGASAGQIRKIAQNEGVLLARISGLMLLIALASILAAGLAVSAAMATTILERRHEIGLMKSLGAHNNVVASFFFAESTLLALAGGLFGFFAGSFMAQRIGILVFNSRVDFNPVLLPLTLLIALAMTYAGSFPSIRRALRFDPAVVLRGGAA